MFKKIVRYIILRCRGVNIDFNSVLTYKVHLKKGFESCQIRNSKLELLQLGNGCFIENVIAYGKIELDDP